MAVVSNTTLFDEDEAILTQNKALSIEALAKKLAPQMKGKEITPHELALQCGFSAGRLKMFDMLTDDSFDRAKVYLYPKFFAKYIMENDDEPASRLFIKRILKKYKKDVDYFIIDSMADVNFIMVELMGDNVDCSLLLKKNTRFGEKVKNYAIVGAHLLEFLQQSKSPFGLFIQDTNSWFRKIYIILHDATKMLDSNDAPKQITTTT